MLLHDLVYRLYERRLEDDVRADALPRHVGVILDGNRRFARKMGLSTSRTAIVAAPTRWRS